jgi:hypothetical protein
VRHSISINDVPRIQAVRCVIGEALHRDPAGIANQIHKLPGGHELAKPRPCIQSIAAVPTAAAQTFSKQENSVITVCSS